MLSTNINPPKVQVSRDDEAVYQILDDLVIKRR